MECKMKNNPVLLTLLLCIVAFSTACWQTAEAGTVQLQTIYSAPKKVIRAEDGGIWTWSTLGDDYYPITVSSQTTETEVQATSKDNAALLMKIAVTYKLKNDDTSVINFVSRYGINEASRAEQFNKVLSGQVNTEAKNAISEYDAYGILANQEAIQKRITDALRPILEQQLYQELESVQIIGRPDFVDNRIEEAASQVVANQKLKEAAQAGLEAAKVEAEKKQVEAQVFSNPALLEIRKMELAKETAEAWSKHNGSLVFGNNAMIGIDK